MAGNNTIRYTLDFRANLTDIQGQLNKLKQSLNTLATPRMGKMSKEFEVASVSAAKLEAHIRNAFNTDTGKLDLSRLNMSLKNTGDNLSGLMNNLLQGGKTGREAFMQVTNAISNAQQPLIKTNALFSQLWTTMKNTMRWQISSMAITGLYSGISKAFNYAKDLNKTLNDIRIVTGDSAAEMDRFAKSANKMAKAVGSTTLDVAKGTLIYRQQGDEAELAARKAEITTKAANVAFDVSADEMSQYLTAIWNSYQVGEDQLELFVDKLAVVGAETATDMAEISTAMEKVAATANTTGVTYDQLLATISTVSSVTRQSAETVGTAFKTIYARIGDLKIDGETVDEDGVAIKLGQVSEQLADANIHILDTNGNIRDMGFIVEEIGEKWQTLENAEKQAIAQTIAGKRQYTQVMALFENWDMYEKTLGKVANAQGALNNQNEIFKESWEGALKEVSNNWQRLVTTLISDDFIIDVIEGFAKFVDILATLTDNLGGFKSILLMIATIFTAKLQPQMASGLLSLAQNFMVLTGQSDKLSQSLLNEANQVIQTKIATGELNNEEATLIKTMMQVANATEAYNRNVAKMDTVTKTQGKMAIDTMKTSLESLQSELIEATIAYNNLFTNQMGSRRSINGSTTLGTEVKSAMVNNLLGNAKDRSAFYKAMSSQFNMPISDIKDFTRAAIEANGNIKNIEGTIRKVGIEAEKAGDKWNQTVNKKFKNLDFTQKISLATTSLMNVQMVMTSLNSIWDTFNDNSKTTGEKIGAAFTALVPIIMSITSSLTTATTAGVGLWTVLWPMLAVAGVTIAWKIFDKLYISAKEATKNVKELSEEIEGLESDMKELESKENSFKSLIKEYDELSSKKAFYGKISETEQNRLIDISKELVDTYDLEYESLNSLTGEYVLAKDAVNQYKDALLDEQKAKGEELNSKREDLIENYQVLLNKESQKKTRLTTTDNISVVHLKNTFEENGYTKEDIREAIKGGWTDQLPHDEYGAYTEEEWQLIYDNWENLDKISESYNEKINLINDSMTKLKKNMIQIFSNEIKTSLIGLLDEERGGSLLASSLNSILEYSSIDTEEKREQLLKDISTFAAEYGGTLEKLQDKIDISTNKINSTTANLSDYGYHYSNLINQLDMYNTMLKEGIITQKEYDNAMSSIQDTITDSPLLTLINIDKTNENFDTNSYFVQLQKDVLDLDNQLKSGKITLIEYNQKLIDLTKDQKRLSNVFGENTEAQKEFFLSIVQNSKNALNTVISNYKSGNSSTMEFIDQIEALSNQFASLEDNFSMFLGDEKIGGKFSTISDSLKDLRTELEKLQKLFPSFSRTSGNSITTLANNLDSLGISYKDIITAAKESGIAIDESFDDTEDGAKTTATALKATSDHYGAAQAAVAKKYQQVLAQIGTNIGQIVSAMTRYLSSFKAKLKGNLLTGLSIEVEGGTLALSSGEIDKFEKNNNIKLSNTERAILNTSDMSDSDFYNYWQENLPKGANYEDYKSALYSLRKRGISGLGVTISNSLGSLGETVDFENLFGKNAGVSQPTGDKGDKFDPESTIEAQINDLIDKYRTIPALLLEALENEADMLDENIHGWEKIIENQIQQNIIRDDLLENEKKLKEGLNTLLNGLLEKYGLTMEEVSKWFNSEGEETAYSKERINKIGISQGKDAASKEEDIVEEFGKVLKASLDSDKKLDELIKEQFEGKQNYIDKFTSLMDDNNAKLEEAIEDLENTDIVNYESMRDLLQLQIQNRMDLINELLAQGLAKDSPKIRALVQEIKGYQEKIIDAFDNEFEQTKSQLEEIYKEIEYQRKKKIEDIQNEITARQKILDLEKKHNSALKDLRATQREINKELASAKMSTQWLDKETRELLFNQSDYYEVSSKVSEIQEYLNDLYVDYSEDIAALGEDELYLADSITKSYEAQVAAKKEELAILKSSLDIEKKRNALNSALSEKNVRVFAGGRWRQVANNEEVTKAYQDYVDSVQNLKEKEIENSENNLIRAEEAQIQALDNLKKSYEEQNKMMKEKLEEMEHDWNLLNSNLELSGKSLGELTKTFNDGVSQLKASMNSLHSQKQAASSIQYGFSSGGGGGSSSSSVSPGGPSGGGQNSDYVNWAKNQMAENSKNWFGADKATQDALAAANKYLASQIGATQDSSGNWIEKNGNKITGNAKGRKDGPGGISQVNELGIELLATNSGQFIELNPHEKIFNNDQMNFLYDFSRRGIASTEKAVSSLSSYVNESMKIDNLTLQLPNVTDTDSFVEGLKGLKEHMRNTNTIK